MTNIFGTPEKVSFKRQLFQAAVETLEQNGWKVERITRSGKSSVRRITRDKDTRVVSIRTTQDRWIAFPRKKKEAGWVTLSEVDAVVAVSVDDPADPKMALVHMIDGKEMRDRFDRAYQARKVAGYTLPEGRGIWVSLYETDARDPVTHVGAGAGLANPPIGRVALGPGEPIPPGPGPGPSVAPEPPASIEAKPAPENEPPLTIQEAKRRLALTLGVDPSSIKITVEA